jgi:predicted alpha-1,2-mannosidase
MRKTIFAALLAVTLTVSGGASPASLTPAVNTFIGTKDEGNTFPGASAPFGMIQVSPIGSHYAGWQYSDPKIRGFGHSFTSGAGCWEQGGQLSILPVTGTIGPGGRFDTGKAESFDHARYAASFTHAGEIGRAGYYKVRLTDYGGIDAEATALTRAAAERYAFAPGAAEGHILVNLGQANAHHNVVGSDLRVVGDRAIEGKIVTQSFCGGHQYATWFRTEFDRPFAKFGVWDGDGGHSGSRSLSLEGDGHMHGAWFTFDLSHGRAVTAITAISHVDAEGARINLKQDGMPFDAMRAEAERRWAQELGSVAVEGGGSDDRAVFYTALYHALLQPLTGSDADGRYRGYDDAIHRADGWTYYEYFSLWDTYRAQNQLIAMLRPDRARDIARSMLAIHDQNGWLPRWGYANFDTNVMSGDPVTPFLVDLWRYGALHGREREAYAALRQNAYGVPPPLVRSEGRGGNPNYLAKGFVQYDRAFPAKGMDTDPAHGASATMEYALADCALSQMAAALGRKDDAADLAARGRNWRNVWDAATVDGPFKGFPRPRLEDGSWYVAPDGGYSPRSQSGFHEGTAWQYQWLVPQDVPGLVAALGGKSAASKRLDVFFAYDTLAADPLHAARKQWVVGAYDYYNQYRYNPNNEPDLHAPWMYELIGQPWKTAMVLRAAQALFTNAPNGVTGNDDLGTMSAWYLFSAIGLYPAMPGSGEILLHPPRFRHVSIVLGNGRELVIDAPGASGSGVQYITAVKFNGRVQDRVWLDWDALRNGGRIDFTLSAKPPTDGWGTSPEALPPPVCH